MEVLRVVGLPENIKEAEENFIKFIHDKMNIDIKGTEEPNPDISVTQEIPRNRLIENDKNMGKQKSTAVIRFIWKRKQIYNARAQLTDTNIFLNEDLNLEE